MTDALRHVARSIDRTRTAYQAHDFAGSSKTKKYARRLLRLSRRFYKLADADDEHRRARQVRRSPR